jgi:hypothetical protein
MLRMGADGTGMSGLATHDSSPDPRNQPVSDWLCIPLVASPFAPQVRSDVHEEVSVKIGARLWRDFPDIPSASSAEAERQGRVSGSSHIKLYRR